MLANGKKRAKRGSKAIKQMMWGKYNFFSMFSSNLFLFPLGPVFLFDKYHIMFTSFQFQVITD